MKYVCMYEFMTPLAFVAVYSSMYSSFPFLLSQRLTQRFQTNMVTRYILDTTVIVCYFLIHLIACKY